MVVDHTHLCFGYHHAIIAALSLLPCLQSTATSDLSPDPQRTREKREAPSERGGACKSKAELIGEDGQRIDVLIVGLGGGALPMFLSKCIPNVS